jgi:hypothetical protein
MVTVKSLGIAFLERKRVIAAIMALAAICALAMTLFFPFSAKVSVKLGQIPNFEAIPYQDAALAPFLTVDRNVLLEMHLDVLRARTLLRKLLVENNLITRNSGEDDVAFDQRLSLLEDRARLVAPTPNSIRAGQSDFLVEFETRRPEQGYLFLNSLFRGADQDVKNKLTELFDREIKLYQLRQSYTRLDLETVRGNLLKDDEKQTEINLTRLEEQAILLRSTGNLGTRAVSVPERNQPNSSGTASVVDSSKIVILPGAESIEKQAELIKARTKREQFIDGLFPVIQKLRDLDQDQTVIRAKQAFASTPLPTDAFRAVTVDLTRANFRKGIWPMVAFAGCLVAGLLASLMLLFVTVIREKLKA